MDYTASYHFLKKAFRQDSAKLLHTANGCSIEQYTFHSPPPLTMKGLSIENHFPADFHLQDDHQISENCTFTYPVFTPEGQHSFSNALILLHGLNERNWTKYLPWAQKLAENLHRPVILFPISFHMNRSPSDWSNPRLMSAMLPGTRLRNHRNHSSTFVNLALSLRLSLQPLRFFTSGSQSARDLEILINAIQTGQHPLFEKGAHVDFFAYSIGAFLAQIMMLTYGESMLSDSRLFMFCGGAPFSSMNGVSKLIMDEEAFLRLRFFYLHQYEREIRSKGSFSNLVQSQPASGAFRAMLDASILSEWRKDRFHKMENRIKAIALKRDKVIPPAGIAELLNSKQLQVIDYASDYTHENPFPLTGNQDLVNYHFDMIFDSAIAFLK
ncbi:MAG: hypothetical protein H6541_11335 [Lentimicrobiaceae bacterium]|nr:hypothetical protein [Lentimicrobiaceae bacterium]MCO5264520.1 DUF6051 family protein [Lentimicrobium sp.]